MQASSHRRLSDFLTHVRLYEHFVLIGMSAVAQKHFRQSEKRNTPMLRQRWQRLKGAVLQSEKVAWGGAGYKEVSGTCSTLATP